MLRMFFRSALPPYTYQIDNMELPAGPDGLETCQAATLGKTSNGRRFSARAQVSFGVTDLLALLHVVSHEIWHTFGLNDCTECELGTSAMNLPKGLSDRISGRNSPGKCDAGSASILYSALSCIYPMLGNELILFDPLDRNEKI